MGKLARSGVGRTCGWEVWLWSCLESPEPVTHCLTTLSPFHSALVSHDCHSNPLQTGRLWSSRFPISLFWRPDVRKVGAGRAVCSLWSHQGKVCARLLPAAGSALACGYVTQSSLVFSLCVGLSSNVPFYEDSSYAGLGVHATPIGPHLN